MGAELVGEVGGLRREVVGHGDRQAGRNASAAPGHHTYGDTSDERRD